MLAYRTSVHLASAVCVTFIPVFCLLNTLIVSGDVIVNTQNGKLRGKRLYANYGLRNGKSIQFDIRISHTIKIYYHLACLG